MEIEKGKKIKLKAEIIIEVSSDKYNDTDSIIDEISSESFYSVESTENVTVIDTNWRDCQLVENSLK